MQIAANTPRLATLFTDLRAKATAYLNAYWAAKDLARYHEMTDEELALRGMTRDDIADRVFDRYLAR
ncbi:MAG: hypothetical protein AAF367_08225 [Pseudomonadota bacterium]